MTWCTYLYINVFSRYSAKTKRDGRTIGQTDGQTGGGGGVAISPVPGAAGDNKGIEDIMDIDSNCPYLLFGETTSHLTSK